MNGDKTEDDIVDKQEFEDEIGDVPFSEREEATNDSDTDGGSEDRLAQLESDLAAAHQAVLYARAEEQNTRRRLEQEKANASTYAATGFARDMLSVSDNLARALAAIPDELRGDEKMKGLVTGLEATGKELESVFRKHGIEPIAALGASLDPNRHQAMVELDHAEAEPGTIVDEMQKGYMIKDRLLRPSLVGVAKKGS